MLTVAQIVPTLRVSHLPAAAKYRGRGEAIFLIGVEFSRETRTLAAFEVESS